MSRYVQRIFFSLLIFWLSACQMSPGLFELEAQPAVSAAPENEVILEIRPVVNAVMSGNIDERKALIKFLNTPCTTETGALGGPPPCAEGEEEGDLVEVFPVLESEGYFLRPSEIELGLQFMVKGLYAVYREPKNPEEVPYWPSGGYALIFDREENDIPFPVTVLVQDGKIARIQHHFGITPEDLLNSVPVKQVVLPPNQGQDMNPTPPTAEPTADPAEIDFSVIPAPLEWPTYRNDELGYQIQYMPDWIVDEYGLSQTPKEVTFNPPDAEDFKVALSVSLDQRTLDAIQQLYADLQPEAVASEVELAGEQGILFRYPWGRVEVYLPHQGQVYLISTDYGDQVDHLQAVGSFRFID